MCCSGDETFLFDHLICSRQHTWRDRQPDLLGRFQIDDELKLRRLLESATRRALRPLGSCPRNWPHAAEGRKEVAASATPLHRGGLNDTLLPRAAVYSLFVHQEVTAKDLPEISALFAQVADKRAEHLNIARGAVA